MAAGEGVNGHILSIHFPSLETSFVKSNALKMPPCEYKSLKIHRYIPHKDVNYISTFVCSLTAWRDVSKQTPLHSLQKRGLELH